ncbi:Mrp/NBP35 family ATP-binding protein [Rubrivirga sp. IMCC43871]|uniref:Mrp/NBP35 family ATP-binding protein n=1 Tax=Rubrivirga sp. IMCC43871 TaxID=3391575 RepID=UPI0039901E5D
MADSPAARPNAPASLAGVTNFVAVASGKGGVGKSTVAANLACALAATGAKVGLMDADVYGPSVPLMFGVPAGEKPQVNEQRHIVPLERFGVKLLSMGFLVDDANAVIWRGPMVSSAVRQFLGQAAWGELDYLILDLPPGTGDIQLTLVQTVPITGAVVVSTPQDVALADARKAVKMFENVHVPVLGVVENMAYFTPPDLPDRKYYLFGEGGAQRLAAELDVPVLAMVPIEQATREAGDNGTPVVLAEPETVTAAAFRELATNVASEVTRRNADAPPTQPIEILYK